MLISAQNSSVSPSGLSFVFVSLYSLQAWIHRMEGRWGENCLAKYQSTEPFITLKWYKKNAEVVLLPMSLHFQASQLCNILTH